MKTERIETKDYFKIGWGAYFADYNYDYIILRDQDPWKVYYRRERMPFHFPNEREPGVTINNEAEWVPVKLDGKSLENYMRRYAKPETWTEVTQKFLEKHDVHMVMDCPSLEIEFIKPNGKQKKMGYLISDFPEKWHPSYQRARRLLRYLEREGKVEKGYDRFIL